MEKSKILKITLAGIYVAMIYAVQVIWGGNQLFVGPLVNALLVLAAATVGLVPALSVAAVSPVLAAINGISDSFDKAVAKMGEVLSITGRILPVTIDDVYLWAHFEDGSMVVGESKIAAARNERHSRIKRVELAPAEAKVLPECINAIEEADLIILGPGSLYTSIIPNLLVDGIVNAIINSDALKLYICNVMTQPGETDGYTVSEHIHELFNHSGGKLFEYSLVNSMSVPQDILDRYIDDGAEPVREDEESLGDLGVEIIHTPIIEISGNWVRHDSGKLAREIMRVFYDKAPTRLYGA